MAGLGESRPHRSGSALPSTGTPRSLLPQPRSPGDKGRGTLTPPLSLREPAAGSGRSGRAALVRSDGFREQRRPGTSGAESRTGAGLGHNGVAQPRLAPSTTGVSALLKRYPSSYNLFPPVCQQQTRVPTSTEIRLPALSSEATVTAAAYYCREMKTYTGMCFIS